VRQRSLSLLRRRIAGAGAVALTLIATGVAGTRLASAATLGGIADAAAQDSRPPRRATPIVQLVRRRKDHS
jgi:O-acetyl-ADP-ribose deacetylase (regulator of RNase III)